MHTLVLFDLDGTLMRVGPAGTDAFNAAGAAVCGPGFSLDRLSPIDRKGVLDPTLFRRAAQCGGHFPTEDQHKQFRQTFLRRLAVELDRQAEHIRVLPGVIDLLSMLRARPRIALGMVTGNYRESAHAKLRAGGIDPAWFVFNGYAGEAETRPQLVELAIRRCRHATGNGVERERVLVVGDTPHDVACARATGCACLAVATGHFTAEQLRDAGADRVVPDLQDAKLLLDLVGG